MTTPQSETPQLSLTPKHLVGRMLIGGTKMRWDGPADPVVDGVCPWSWLVAAPADTAVKP